MRLTILVAIPEKREVKIKVTTPRQFSLLTQGYMANKYIQADFPQMDLDSHDVPPPDYEMWSNWKVADGTSIDHITKQIRKIAQGAPGGKLSTLIFNSHGNPGKKHIGQGITEQNLHHFQLLRKDEKTSLVDQIWIVACQVGGQADNVSGAPSGEQFFTNRVTI